MTEEDYKLKKIANRFIRRNRIDKIYSDCVSELIIKAYITAYKLAKHREKTDLQSQLTKKDKQIEELEAKYYSASEIAHHRGQCLISALRENRQFESQIEKMKNCQNCTSFHKGAEYPCDIGNNENSFNCNCCDCWQLKE